MRSLLSAISLQLGAVQDNTLYQNNADVSNGQGEFILAGGGHRGLVQFDLSQIPEGATILDAVLTMNVAVSSGSASAVSVHRVGQAWGESGSNAPGDEMAGDLAQEFDATWVYSFYDGRLWSTPGGDFAASSASTSVGGLGTYEWMGGSLIDDVQSWVDDPGSNFGWLVQLVGSSVKSFVSKDGPDSSLVPTLEVTFEGPPAIVEGRIWNDANGDGLKLDPVVADLGLTIVGGNTFYNAFNGGEYWFRSSDTGKWYYLTEDGSLYRWTGPSGQLQGVLVSKLDPRFHYDPSLISSSSHGDPEPWLDGWTVELLNASGVVVDTTTTSGRDLNLDGVIDSETEGGWYQFIVDTGETYSVRQVLPSGWAQTAKITYDTESPLNQVVNSLGLHFRTSYYQNFGGLSEKWVYSDQRGWHYITPDGTLYRWNGKSANPLTGSRVATVGEKYYQDPSLLSGGGYSADDGANPIVSRVDFGNAQAGEVRGRIWLDFFPNGIRDNIDLIPQFFVLYPLEPLAAGSEWFYDYTTDDWYIIDVNGQPSYWGPNTEDGGDDFTRGGGGGQLREFIESEVEPWINGRTVELVDGDGNVVATTTTRSVDLNNDGVIQAESERGWYIFPEVPSGDYTVRTVAQSGWVITAPLDEVQTLAVTLDAQYGFHRSVSDFRNWGQEDERWFLDRDDHWFYILPDGNVYEWIVNSGPTTGGLRGVLKGSLSSAYHDDLDLIATPDTSRISVSVSSSTVSGDVLFGNHRLLDDLISSL
ncbi:MAG: DNRLRE domain-containing protein [Planctomycetaceae bacterium]|nr:DNRLRE domain-containing protein [Planctomycetaceae bacterium]